MKNTIYIAFLLFFSQTLDAQESEQLDTFVLEFKQKQDFRLQRIVGNQLSDLLSNSTLAFVKNNGPGSMATIRVRGLSANHNLLVWEGLPMISGMHGNLDLSIVPVFQGHIYSFDPNGDPLAMGGVVSMKQSLRENEGLSTSLGQSVGSFGQYGNHFGLKSKKKKLSSSFDLSGIRAKNDFKYSLDNSSKIYTMERAEFEQIAFQGKLSYQTNSNAKFVMSYFFQESHRNLAKKITQDYSLSSQADETRRIVGSHRFFHRNKLMVESKFGYNQEKIHFQNQESGIDAPSVFESYIAKTSIKGVKRNPVSFTVTNIYTAAYAKEYGQIKYQNQNLCAYNKQIFQKQSIFNFGLNSAVWDNKKISILPSFSWLKPHAKYSLFSLKLKRKNRFPTLNENYWVRNRVQLLEPEIGWFAELCFDFKRKKGGTTLASNSKAFGHLVDNWIEWTPNDEMIWNAQNLQKVRALGFDQSFFYQRQMGKSLIKLNSSHRFIQSKFLNTSKWPRVKSFDRVWYTPKWQNQINIEFSKNIFSLSYEHFWSSSFKGIDAELKAYQLGRINFCLNKILKERLNLNIIANNIWNETYRLVENRPMPLRNFQFQIIYQLNKNNFL